MGHAHTQTRVSSSFLSLPLTPFLVVLHSPCPACRQQGFVDRGGLQRLLDLLVHSDRRTIARAIRLAPGALYGSRRPMMALSSLLDVLEELVRFEAPCARPTVGWLV